MYLTSVGLGKLPTILPKSPSETKVAFIPTAADTYTDKWFVDVDIKKLNDTLVKTKEIRYKALKDAGKTFYNQEITDQHIHKFWGLPFNSFISGIYNNADTPENLTENYKSILHNYPNEPFPETNNVLDIFSKKYLLGVISSSNPDLIMGGMENTNINPDLFFFIQSSLH